MLKVYQKMNMISILISKFALIDKIQHRCFLKILRDGTPF